jgi:inhibitor of KinA sporulation pathway (predicted exonuclease)
VDKARSFDHAFPHFQDWMDLVEAPQTICTWGDKDIPIIREEASRHGIEVEGLSPYIDMKAQYPKLNGLKKEISLQKAMEYHGLEFEGHQHRALDDAYNTARLFLHFLDRWIY